MECSRVGMGAGGGLRPVLDASSDFGKAGAGAKVKYLQSAGFRAKLGFAGKDERAVIADEKTVHWKEQAGGVDHGDDAAGLFVKLVKRIADVRPLLGSAYRQVLNGKQESIWSADHGIWNMCDSAPA